MNGYDGVFTSLDPAWTVERLVREPLDRFKIGTDRERVEPDRHGTVTDIFDSPRQPYTRSLLASMPSGGAGVAHVPQPRTRLVMATD